MASPGYNELKAAYKLKPATHGPFLLHKVYPFNKIYIGTMVLFYTL